MIRKPAEIELESMEIIRAELKEREIALLPENEAVVLRCIHASADFDYAGTLRFTDGAVKKAEKSLLCGTDIVTDTNMAKSGINKKALTQ